MKNISLRGIDEKLERAIKERAKKNHESMNTTILKALQQAFGLERQENYPEYSDLEELAGTWSVRDEREFNETQSDFQKIDDEMWK